MTTGLDALPSSPSELQALVDQRAWFHSIDLGNGVRTKGLSELMFSVDDLPSFSGRTVLDIGAWDGYYSFLAEREGAARAVALDHYAWGVDFDARGAYWNECFERGELPDHTLDTSKFWRPDLPGRGGFDLAHRILKSRVEAVTADFMTADLDALGHFDVVLYLGVLYHMKEPLTALERVRQVTTEVAVIETEALFMSNLGDAPLLHFEAGGRVGGDFGNWYVPTVRALHDLCRAAGFKEVRTVLGPPSPPAPPPPPPAIRSTLGQRALSLFSPAAQQRLLSWLGADGSAARPLPPASSGHYRVLVHAFV